MYKKAFVVCLAVFFFVSAANAQKAEVSIGLNEAFFDALLDSVFQNFDPPEFPIAQNIFNRRGAEARRKQLKIENGEWKMEKVVFQNSSFSILNSQFSTSSASPRLRDINNFCSQTVKILREMNGVRTAVRFRDGRIYVPLAFSGNYSPPFIGCVEFAGWAESNIDLEFDQNTKKLIGRVRVLNVNLNGSGGIGGTLIARLIQSSIDKKLNPIEILSIDKLSFGVPIRKSGNLRMKALRVRPEVSNGLLNIRVDYEFLKG